MKFLSRNTPEPPAATESATDAEGGAGKGRPTPTRKEAEAQRKHTLKVPTDPKAAKKAARARAAEERQVQRAAMMSGDERYLPARDSGPVRAFVRDYVDGRWAAAELFLPLALFVLALGFLPSTVIRGYVNIAWMLLTMFIIVDTSLLMLRLNKELKKRWPTDADRKGAIFYAVMRVLQIRKLRLPPPRLRAGGKPVKVKAAKADKGTPAK